MKVTFFKYSHSIGRFSNRNAIYVITYSLPFHFNPNFCLEQEILQSERCLSSIKFHDHRINLKICFLLMERTRLNFGRHQRNDISLCSVEFPCQIWFVRELSRWQCLKTHLKLAISSIIDDLWSRLDCTMYNDTLPSIALPPDRNIVIGLTFISALALFHASPSNAVRKVHK